MQMNMPFMGGFFTTAPTPSGPVPVYITAQGQMINLNAMQPAMQGINVQQQIQQLQQLIQLQQMQLQQQVVPGMAAPQVPQPTPTPNIAPNPMFPQQALPNVANPFAGMAPADLQRMLTQPNIQQLLNLGNMMQATAQPVQPPVASVPASSRTSQCSEETRSVQEEVKSDGTIVDDVQTRPAGERPPCTHNKWTRREEERARRVKKKRPLVLCCLVCQMTWKTKLRLHKKCPDFFNGDCKKGDSCPYPHIYSRKVAAAAGILVPPSVGVRDNTDSDADDHSDAEEQTMPPLDATETTTNSPIDLCDFLPPMVAPAH